MRYISSFLFSTIFVMMSVHHTVYAEKELSSIPNQNISLWPEEDTGKSIFKNFKLKIGGSIYQFKDWYNVPNESFYPEMKFEDITGDKNPEIVIILTEGTGTGVNITKVHVLKQNDTGMYEEVDVQDPLLVMKKRVKSKLNTKKVTIRIDGKSNIINIHSLKIKKKDLYDELVTGNHINYEVKHNKLIVLIDTSISPGRYIGDFELTYKFINGKFKVDTIDFKKIKNF